jgi:hypothetical protein
MWHLDLMILMRENPLLRPLEGVGHEIKTFLGPKMATSETHVHKNTNVPFLYGAWN